MRPTAAAMLVPWMVLAILAPVSSETWPVMLTDVAERAGLRQTNGAGVAFIDVDNDGRIDALVPSGVRLKDGTREPERYPPGAAPVSRL